MDEEWVIEKATGSGGQIKVVFWKYVFTKSGFTHEVVGTTQLREAIPSTSSNREIIQKLHEAIGDIRLDGIRSNAQRRLDDKIFQNNEDEVYFEKQPTVEDVHREYGIRLGRGITIPVTNVGDIKVNPNTDINNIAIVGLLSRFAGGQPEERDFIDADGTVWSLTGQQALSLWGDWDNWVLALEKSAKALKEMSPIPSDYKNDSYWQ